MRLDSGKCNDYSTNDSANPHCCGLRIDISTFTAEGLAAPIFVMIYRLTPDKMPHNEIVTIPIPRLIVGSEHNIYPAKEVDYVTVVREMFETLPEREELMKKITSVLMILIM